MSARHVLSLFFILFFGVNALAQELLESDLFWQSRNGLANAHQQFRSSGDARVAFLGGSITYGPGWRDSIMMYLENSFPQTKFDFIAAGISSMGSTPSAFRLDRDVLSHGQIDLLFQEAAVNDATNGRSTHEQIRAQEGIIRHLRNENPLADIVMMHFVDPEKMADYRERKIPEVIRNHEFIADYYGIPSINLAKEVTERIDAGEFSWEDDFKNLHPSPFGQGIYSRSMIGFLESQFGDSINNVNEKPDELPRPFDPFNYSKGKLLSIKDAVLSTGWEIKDNWKPNDSTGTRANYTDAPMLIGRAGAGILKFAFEGKAIGIAVAAGRDAGMVEHRVDGGDWQVQNLFTRWSSHLHLPWYHTLESELNDGQHMLELRMSAEKDERSEGMVCRVRYFYVNEN